MKTSIHSNSLKVEVLLFVAQCMLTCMVMCVSYIWNLVDDKKGKQGNYTVSTLYLNAKLSRRMRKGEAGLNTYTWMHAHTHIHIRQLDK